MSPNFFAKLNQNESPWDIPPPIKKKILRMLEKKPWNRYPHFAAAPVTKKVAKTFGVNPQGVIISNGSNSLVQSLILATAVNSRVLTIYPTFPLYRNQALMLGNKVTEVPLGQDFSFPLEKILKAIKKSRPKIVFIANPNVPTGNLFPKEALLKIVRKAPCLVVIDEAYYPVSGRTLLPVLLRHKNLVILRTFSKVWGVAGVHAGVMFSHPEVAREVRKTMVPFAFSVLSSAVIDLLIDYPEVAKKNTRLLIKERARLFSAMSKIKGITVYPSDSNFLMFRVKSAKKVFNRLVKKGILIRDVSDNKMLKDCLRITIGTPRENSLFLSAL